MAVTQIADLAVPEIFVPYTQQAMVDNLDLLRSGALVRDQEIGRRYTEGGLTFNMPSFQDLADSDADINNDTSSLATPQKVESSLEIGVWMRRSKSFSSMDLAGELAGADPMTAVTSRFGNWASREFLKTVISILVGVFSQNVANDGSDMVHSVIGGAFADGVTNFTMANLTDLETGFGEYDPSRATLVVHPNVFGGIRKKNLIDFIPDTTNPAANSFIRTVGEHQIIRTRQVPNPAHPVHTTAAGIYHSYLLAPGSLRFDEGTRPIPVEPEREARAGNGGGQSTLTYRWARAIHPTGHSYVGTTSQGGPSNLTSANNLGDDASWDRVFTQREQVPMGLLITREA